MLVLFAPVVYRIYLPSTMTTKYDKTFIALDYGEKRIGIAKSDPTGLIASPIKTIEIKSINRAAEEIVALIKEHDANGLVVGYPLMPSGDKSEICDRVDLFIERILRLCEIQIYRQDERHSSQEAIGVIHAHGKKSGRDKARIDRIAAVLILQRFLDGLSSDQDRQ